MKNKITTLILLLLALYGGLNAQQEYESCFGKDQQNGLLLFQPLCGVWKKIHPNLL
jgi:hypothetical protein